MSTPNGNWSSNRKFVLESMNSLETELTEQRDRINQLEKEIEKLERFKIQLITIVSTIQVAGAILFALLRVKH